VAPAVIGEGVKDTLRVLAADGLTTMPDCVPLMLPFCVSVAVSDCVPTVLPSERLTDCLCRAEIAAHRNLPHAARCIATVATGSFAPLLDDMLGSVIANGRCQDALRVVFSVGDDAECRRIAAKYGRKLHETSIGFKYIADLMMEREILIGGEESGGIGYSRFLPERDGVLNCLLLANVMAEEGKPEPRVWVAERPEEAADVLLRRLHLPRKASSRERPIPVFAEMGSVNPIVVTEAALAERSEAIAEGLAASVASFGGQLCTKPGVVFVPAGEEGDDLLPREESGEKKTPEQRVCRREESSRNEECGEKQSDGQPRADRSLQLNTTPAEVNACDGQPVLRGEVPHESQIGWISAVLREVLLPREVTAVPRGPASVVVNPRETRTALTRTDVQGDSTESRWVRLTHNRVSGRRQPVAAGHDHS